MLRTKTTYVTNTIIIISIIISFLVSAILISDYAKNDCFKRIEESVIQMTHMLNNGIIDDRQKLEMLADVLATNESNPDALLTQYMKHFCETHNFSALCIHRRNGTTISFGEHPHNPETFASFDTEVAKVPYISDIISLGDNVGKKVFYHGVPIVKDGYTVAIVYGYMRLRELPQMFTIDAYDGKGQVYIVDGSTGDFLMDALNDGKPRNLYDEIMDGRESKPGYKPERMRDDIKSGRDGFYVFRSQTTGEWFYTYYMPIGVNDWSMQMTIDESTAFESYDYIGRIIAMLAAVVVFLTLLYVIILMQESAHSRKHDAGRIRKTDYMYKVQQTLFNAHANSDLIERALGMTGNELAAETVLLMTFSEKVVNRIYYWPSKDKQQAMELLGKNIREDFPVIYDMLADNKIVVYDTDSPAMEISVSARRLLGKFNVCDVMLAPMIDNNTLYGVLCAVNMKDRAIGVEMLECVRYDFFMAARNIENYNIIKNMGVMDYLTDIKNRNSYEVELDKLPEHDFDNLWCIFIDVNGLHDINNKYGHKAGDLMLCAVAKVIKKAFGTERTYRVGGDEFVAFMLNAAEADVKNKKMLIEAELRANNYYISVGYASMDRKGSDVFKVEAVVAEAEEMMYREKKAFYDNNDIFEER